MFPQKEAISWNIDQIGYADLDGKAGFKMAIHRVGDRWYLYSALLWEPGFVILDITDPHSHRYIKHVPGPADTMTFQIQIADGKMITAMEAIPDFLGGHEGPWEHEGFTIWDLEDPENPRQLGVFKTGGSGTHRNYYDGGQYVYATGLPDGYDGHILQIVDISDPANPTEVSRWWREGQWLAGGEGGVSAGTLLHGGAYVKGDRAYLPYSAGGFVILDISDLKTPKLVSDLPFSPPFEHYIAVHTALPLQNRPEPPRDCRRPQLLRGRGFYEQDHEQVFARGPRTCGANGAGARAGSSVALGGGGIHFREDRLFTAHAS